MRAPVALVVFALGMAPLAAQASSPNHVLTSADAASGGTCSSPGFGLTATLGDGVPARSAQSANFALLGGFVATLDVDPRGLPWLMGVAPTYVTMKGGATLQLHGTAFTSGLSPAVTIAGMPAAITALQDDRITTTLPFAPGPVSRPAPGWQPVTVTNTVGSTTLPRGIGILPMVDADPAPAPNVGFDVVFRGSPGDQVLWALGVAPAGPIPLPGILHGLGLNPSLILMLPAMTITAPSGVLRFAVPPTPYLPPIYLQGVFATTNPGYAPAAFSNVLRL